MKAELYLCNGKNLNQLTRNQPAKPFMYGTTANQLPTITGCHISTNLTNYLFYKIDNQSFEYPSLIKGTIKPNTMKFFKHSSLRLFALLSATLVLSICFSQVHAQSVGISSSSITPDASSILEMRTTSKGLLIPRMTSTERNAINSPATGLMVYNTSTNSFNYYNGGSWIAVSSGSGSVNSVSGTSNRIAVGGTSSDPVIDIASGYVGQSSITTVGTISSGTWNGSVIASAYGGAGAVSGVLKANGSGTVTAASAGDFPTLNQNSTGSAATLTTSRLIYGGSFNGSANVTNIIASTYGGTGNGFTKFTGAATAEKTYTLPNANATILTDNAAVTVAQGGTGNNSYTVGDLLYASGATTLSKLSGVATGNALISGGSSTAPSWGKIGLTTHISGTLPIANGGTNSAAALNNNRIMVSSGSAITEAAALTNGQVLIGSTGAAPVAANLTAGNGITITNAAGSVAIANVPVISMVESTTDATIISNSYAVIPGMTITPGAGDYLLYFNGSVELSNDDKELNTAIFVNGTMVTGSDMPYGQKKSDPFSVSRTAYLTGITAGQTIDIRWRISQNSATIHNRSLILQKVK